MDSLKTRLHKFRRKLHREMLTARDDEKKAAAEGFYYSAGKCRERSYVLKAVLVGLNGVL